MTLLFLSKEVVPKQSRVRIFDGTLKSAEVLDELSKSRLQKKLEVFVNQEL